MKKLITILTLFLLSTSFLAQAADGSDYLKVCSKLGEVGSGEDSTKCIDCTQNRILEARTESGKRKFYDGESEVEVKKTVTQ